MYPSKDERKAQYSTGNNNNPVSIKGLTAFANNLPSRVKKNFNSKQQNGTASCLCEADKKKLLMALLGESINMNADMFGFSPNAVNNDPNLVAMVLNSSSLNLANLLPRIVSGIYSTGLGATFSSSNEVALSPAILLNFIATLTTQDWNVNSLSATFNEEGNYVIGADVFTSITLPPYTPGAESGHLGFFISVDTFNTNRGMSTLEITAADGYNVSYKKLTIGDTAYIYIPPRKASSDLNSVIANPAVLAPPALAITVTNNITVSSNKFDLLQPGAEMIKSSLTAKNCSLTIQSVPKTPSVLVHLLAATITGDFGNFFEHLKENFRS